ncbi:uncharacterized protein LOC129292774 [Prosopis cineraria]|uniref:uncharacterized protein LOC129292774 n=1 Tax=Prosopis cineraria TaxID=364024 RepID=UPI002410085B|nr:uncharacterized protein LOC129292774 [Prosopis cineraria]XP_054786391.1 uncharacterized protein LOC129292774 [Prosopis cineraria]XP_054786392.1 uncharacterized protein LOC129292774 [Prosopis cineraria]XP_054786393.1 uncharacterized protein LOC129292774 [Prosopis cineraria]XP_054786394.1 uncharacterized protein LOC129292774 [Prosopis cineraria]
MPVSGREETGVKSYDGQFSGLIAAVPIKKRRFPLIPTFSPLSGEQDSLTEENENESLRKEHSSTPQGSTVSNASVADAPIKKRRLPSVQASSSSEELSSLPEENNASHRENSSTTLVSTLSINSAVLFDTNNNPAFVGKNITSEVTTSNLAQSNSNYVSPKIEEPDLASHSRALDDASGKEKLIASESYEKKSGPQVKKENSELLLAAKESLALNIGSKISKRSVEEKDKQESCASTNLSLGFKEHLSPAVPSLDIGERFQKTQKAGSVSLKLSLSKEESSSKSCSDDARTSRANWDLNTTMDAWEEPGSDAPLGKTCTSGKTSTSACGLQIAGKAPNDNNVMCSPGMEPTGSASIKHTTAENRNKAFVISSRQYGQEYENVNPRNICVASCLQKYTGEPSRLSVKEKTDLLFPTLSLSNASASAVDGNKSSVMIVKSEPLDENLKQDSKEAKPSPVGSLDGVTVKHELVERSSVDYIKTTSKGSNLKLLDPKFVKYEPGHSNNQGRPMMMENVSDQMGAGSLQGSDNHYSLEKSVTLESAPFSAGTACPPVEGISSEQLTTSASMVSHQENHASIDEAYIDEKTSEGDCSGDKEAPPETVATAMVDNAELSGPAVKDCARGGEEKVDDAEGCRLKLMNEHPLDTRCSGEDGVSDDEKITLSADMLEDDSYGYDYESDGTHSLTVAMDVDQRGEEDDDYEDGEVREPLKHSVAEESVCEVREVERVVSSHCDDGKQIEKEVLGGDCPTSSCIDEDDNRTVTRTKINCGKEGIDDESINMSHNVTDKTVCLQESLEAENPNVGPQIRSLDYSERNKALNARETKLVSEDNNGSNEVDVAQCADEVVKNLDMVRTDLDLPKMEVSVDIDNASKDVSDSGNQGRIINLAQAASPLSPTKSRSIPGRALPSQAGRDALPDAFHNENLHGGRDDIYIDGPCKFSRERYQDISPRNSRLSFVRGRGRINSRIDTCRGEWKSDRDFAGEFYNGPSHFRGPRNKFVSAVHDAESEYNNVTHDGSFVGNNRLGRKPLNDDRPVGRHITLRRRSPGARESLQMGHRIPRTMSPSRCVGDDGSEFVNMRHGEKFLRGYPQDTMDPMFSRPPPFERGDGRFTRGTRSFIQRRGPPRIHSKSPIRSTSRSPGPWSSSRRRSPRGSPDGFGGHPELAHRRYRVDRMRSPDGPIFSGERRVVRRHVSPYMSRPSNDTRDFDSGRGRGHPRSIISNRGTSGRIMFRNRRFDAVDPQDRPDNDEYFGGPMHSGRQFELNGEGNGDERRRFGERQGPVRSFRPPYNGGVSENFDLDAEDGPRNYRFCAADSEFQERSNLRERDFDRRVKNRPANMPPRRARNIDEQEANYRNSGQEVWSDDGFDDISRVKRKRF